MFCFVSTCYKRPNGIAIKWMSRCTYPGAGSGHCSVDVFPQRRRSFPRCSYPVSSTSKYNRTHGTPFTVSLLYCVGFNVGLGYAQHGYISYFHGSYISRTKTPTETVRVPPASPQFPVMFDVVAMEFRRGKNLCQYVSFPRPLRTDETWITISSSGK